LSFLFSLFRYISSLNDNLSNFIVIIFSFPENFDELWKMDVYSFVVLSLALHFLSLRHFVQKNLQKSLQKQKCCKKWNVSILKYEKNGFILIPCLPKILTLQTEVFLGVNFDHILRSQHFLGQMGQSRPYHVSSPQSLAH